jgi:hypothetical protein
MKIKMRYININLLDRKVNYKKFSFIINFIKIYHIKTLKQFIFKIMEKYEKNRILFKMLKVSLVILLEIRVKNK